MAQLRSRARERSPQNQRCAMQHVTNSVFGQRSSPAPATSAAWTRPILRSGLEPEPSSSRWSKLIFSYRRVKAPRPTLPNAQTANSSTSGRLAAVASRSPPGGAGRSQLGAPNRELVRPNFSAIPLETELGKGELARSPVIRRGPLPRAPRSVVCGTLSKRPLHLLAL